MPEPDEQVYRAAARALVDAVLDERRPTSVEWYRQKCADGSATDIGLRAAVEVAYRAGHHDGYHHAAEQVLAATDTWCCDTCERIAEAANPMREEDADA